MSSLFLSTCIKSFLKIVSTQTPLHLRLVIKQTASFELHLICRLLSNKNQKTSFPNFLAFLSLDFVWCKNYLPASSKTKKQNKKIKRHFRNIIYTVFNLSCFNVLIFRSGYGWVEYKKSLFSRQGLKLCEDERLNIQRWRVNFYTSSKKWKTSHKMVVLLGKQTKL